jgi:tyrosine-protein phosphatase YwqE
LLASLFSSLDFQKFSDYSKSSFSQIFYKIYGQNLTMKCIFAPERIDSLIKKNEDLTASLIKVDAIKWLRLTQVSIEKLFPQWMRKLSQSFIKVSMVVIGSYFYMDF